MSVIICYQQQPVNSVCTRFRNKPQKVATVCEIQAIKIDFEYFSACQNGYLDQVDCLIEAGAKCTPHKSTKCTPLYAAIRSGLLLSLCDYVVTLSTPCILYRSHKNCGKAVGLFPKRNQCYDCGELVSASSSLYKW